MYFFVTATMSHPDRAADYRDEETRVLNELWSEGVVTSAYLRTDGQGLVGIVQRPPDDDAAVALRRLRTTAAPCRPAIPRPANSARLGSLSSGVLRQPTASSHTRGF